MEVEVVVGKIKIDLELLKDQRRLLNQMVRHIPEFEGVLELLNFIEDRIIQQHPYLPSEAFLQSESGEPEEAPYRRIQLKLE
jgi:hypothetical protein